MVHLGYSSAHLVACDGLWLTATEIWGSERPCPDLSRSLQPWQRNFGQWTSRCVLLRIKRSAGWRHGMARHGAALPDGFKHSLRCFFTYIGLKNMQNLRPGWPGLLFGKVEHLVRKNSGIIRWFQRDSILSFHATVLQPFNGVLTAVPWHLVRLCCQAATEDWLSEVADALDKVQSEMGRRTGEIVRTCKASIG